MKAVHTTTTFHEARFVQSVLRENEIPCIVENEGGALYAIGLATPATPLVVRVSDEDEARGLSLIGLALRGPAEPDDEDAEAPTPEEEQAFKEKVERSREETRSAWALVLCFLVPPMFPILCLLYPSLLPSMIRRVLRWL